MAFSRFCTHLATSRVTLCSPALLPGRPPVKFFSVRCSSSSTHGSPAAFWTPAARARELQHVVDLQLFPNDHLFNVEVVTALRIRSTM
jgi:hypothetical protein